MSTPPSNGKSVKKRVSIACVKCRDRKVKCIPAPGQEHPRCTRCLEKNHECQYMTVSAQTEQRGSLTTQEQTDCYPHHGSSPPPATPVYSQPPAVDSTYSYPQHSFSNQPYPPSTYQIADHQNAPAISYPPLSHNAQPISFSPPSNNAPAISFSPPSNMASAHQGYYPPPRHPPPRQPFPYAQPSSPIRSGQDISGNYGTHGYFDSTYQAQSTHQTPMNQQYYNNQEWHQGHN